MLIIVNEVKASRLDPERFYQADMIIVLCDDGQHYRIAKDRFRASDGTERFPLTDLGNAVQYMINRRWLA